jgi:hypothetical protein
MAGQPSELEQVVHEIRSANAALVEEVRGLRQAVIDALRQQQRRREWLALSMVIAFMVFPALAAGGMWLTLPLPKETRWEQQQQQQQQQLDRTDRALDRADKLLGRWEKVSPRE